MKKEIINKFKATFKEENIELNQRQKNILQLLLSKEEANYYISKLDYKEKEINNHSLLV
tara:strand:- start:188 stop:364 length:177 start_codon:yes stop_codon:yes gene_type:complete